MHRAKAMSIVILLAGLPAAGAADWNELDGSYLVAGKDYLDPPDDAPKNTHLFVQLHGRAAEDLFNAMPSEAAPDACTGGMMKTAGQMACLHVRPSGETAERYECSFSIDLARQTIEGGVAC